MRVRGFSNFKEFQMKDTALYNRDLTPMEEAIRKYNPFQSEDINKPCKKCNYIANSKGIGTKPNRLAILTHTCK
jgi:hypothetical protein